MVRELVADVDECNVDIVFKEGLKGTLNLLRVADLEVIAGCVP